MNVDRKKTIILIVAIASIGCTTFNLSDDGAEQKGEPSTFDPLSLPERTLGPDSWLDPISFHSKNAYVVEPIVSNCNAIASNARFADHHLSLTEYLKEACLESVRPGIGWLSPPSLRFNINASGRAEQVQLIHSSGNTELDHTLIEVVANMPVWEPATDRSGHATQQSFRFNIIQAGC